MLHKIVLTVLLVTLTISVAIKLYNIDTLAYTLGAAEPKRVSFMFKAENDINKAIPVPGPNSTRILQSFVSYEDNLYGLYLPLLNVVDDNNILYNVTIYDSEMNAIRTASWASTNEAINEIYFRPITNSYMGLYYFSIEASSSSDANKLKIQLARPRITYPIGVLYVDNIKMPSLFNIYTVHRVTSFLDYCNIIGNYFSFPFILIGILIAYIGYMVSKLKAIYYVILFFGLIQVFIEIPFSGVDEGAHFDNVNYIVNHNKLPYFYDNNDANDLFNLTNSIGNLQSVYSLSRGYPLYEAVHPPLYYVMSSVIARLVSLVNTGMAYRFYALRFTGVFMLVGTAYFIIKSYKCIIDAKLLPRNDILLYLLLLLFFCSPGYLNVIVAVTNEQLLLLLISISLYFVLQTLIKKEHIKISTVLMSSLLSALIILTKLTAAPVFLLFTLLLLHYRNKTYVMVYCVLTAALISPWLLYNYTTYGDLTISMRNVALTVPNYKDLHLSFPDYMNNFYKFVRNFFIGHNMSDVLKGLTKIMWFGYILTLICLLYKLFLIVHEKIYAKQQSAAKRVGLFMLITLLAQYMYLLVITASVNINHFQPRYTYCYMSFYIMLIYFVVVQKKNKPVSMHVSVEAS